VGTSRAVVEQKHQHHQQQQHPLLNSMQMVDLPILHQQLASVVTPFCPAVQTLKHDTSTLNPTLFVMQADGDSADIASAAGICCDAFRPFPKTLNPQPANFNPKPYIVVYACRWCLC
jgi:hypothetical protein